MKSLLKIWLGLVIIFALGFWIWFPSEKQIKGCMTTSMFDVELCSKSKDYVQLNQISKNVQRTQR
jgi:monofunctional biosynthetic peptidoglycan transglycosylase